MAYNSAKLAPPSRSITRDRLRATTRAPAGEHAIGYRIDVLRLQCKAGPTISVVAAPAQRLKAAVARGTPIAVECAAEVKRHHTGR